MARIINELRIVNAKLGTKNNINSPAIYYAAKDGFDGYSMISVSSLPSAELFIGQGTQAHEDITEWTLFNSQAQYGGIGANAFARFQNLESVTIWQEDTDDLLVIDDNAFYSNVELAHIYVPPDLLAQYQSTYSGKSFVSLFEAYELITDLVVPTSFNSEIAPTTLTKAWLDLVFANMPTIERNAKVNLIVPDYFTGIDSNAFSGLGSSFNYLNEIKCNGSKTFASGFLNGASWCKHLWLDNGSSTLASPYCTDDTVIYANFRVVAPYLVFSNYFMQEHNIKTGVVCPIVGYNQFSSGASLPQESPTGEYLWFSNIDFDSDYDSPTGLENDDSYISSYVASSSGYYYCYDKTEILVIQGSGASTSDIVESAINGLNTPKTWITKVVVPNTFTLNTSASAGCLDVCDTYLPNVTTLELNQAINVATSIYTNFANSNCKFKNIIFNYNSIPTSAFENSYIEYFESSSLTQLSMYSFQRSQLKDVKLPNLITLTAYSFRAVNFGNNDLLLEKCETLGVSATYQTNCDNAYFPKLTDGGPNDVNLRSITTGGLFIGSDTFTIGAALDITAKGMYIKANVMNYYKTYANLSSMTNKIIGVIDGGDTYANIKNRGVSMNYPTLTGIDTETNIQLLTPADNSLYLASDTGNLWQYSNGAWSNLFSGYIPTWYSDEDVSTIVLPSAITSDMTVYVKITAI